MLVLSSKVEKAIVMDDDIRPKVIVLQGEGGRLGLGAPAEVIILRSENRTPQERLPDPGIDTPVPSGMVIGRDGRRNPPPAKQGSPHPSSRRTWDPPARRGGRPGAPTGPGPGRREGRGRQLVGLGDSRRVSPKGHAAPLLAVLGNESAWWTRPARAPRASRRATG